MTTAQLPKRPILMLTTHIAKTYNQILLNNQSKSVAHSSSADEKGYFIAYENQQINNYVVKKALGQGSFGRVMLVEAKDKSLYALKICRCQDYFTTAMKAEVGILKLLKEKCPEITVGFIEDFDVGKHVGYVMEFMDLTLYQRLKNTRGKGFSLKEIQIITRQFAEWLVSLEKLDIVHTDMKPENMVMNANALEMKLIDFGSAILLSEGSRPSYIQSRFYRAPEIVLGVSYNNRLDAWSLGALLVELFTTYVMFPAKSSPMLCKQYISLLGLPDEKFVLYQDDFNNNCIRHKVERYFQLSDPIYYQKHELLLSALNIPQNSIFYPTEEVLLVEDRPQCQLRNLQDILSKGFHHSDSQTDLENFLEVVSNMLVYDANSRWGGKEILDSKFLQD